MDTGNSEVEAQQPETEVKEKETTFLNRFFIRNWSKKDNQATEQTTPKHDEAVAGHAEINSTAASDGASESSATIRSDDASTNASFEQPSFANSVMIEEKQAPQQTYSDAPSFVMVDEKEAAHSNNTDTGSSEIEAQQPATETEEKETTFLNKIFTWKRAKSGNQATEQASP